MSQALGAGDVRRAKALAGTALKWNSLVSIGLFVFWLFCSRAVYALMGVQGDVLRHCVEYTRIASVSFLFSGATSAMTAIVQASGWTRPLMYAGALRSGLNVVLDWLLILGSLGFPKMGIRGAATASVLADLAGAILLGVLILRSSRLPARPSLRAVLTAPLSAYGAVVRMGIPTSLEELMWNVGNLFLIRFLNILDPLATAVYSLVFTIEILPIVFFMSLGQTTTVLVGRAKGAGDEPRTRGSHDLASGGVDPFGGTGARVRRGAALADRHFHAGRRHHRARGADPARIVLHILSALC